MKVENDLKFPCMKEDEMEFFFEAGEVREFINKAKKILMPLTQPAYYATHTVSPMELAKTVLNWFESGGKLEGSS